MRSLLVILSREQHQAWAEDLINKAAVPNPVILVTSPADAARYLEQNTFSPSHIVCDIGTRGADILSEIDALAQQCEPGTKVIAVGDTNDILLYREFISRGILDYMPMPAVAETLLAAFAAADRKTAAAKALAPVANKRVIVFMSAASGDGASTAALNTAYAMASMGQGKTILVDMDYQFGMVAKHLALQNKYGIGDLFDHPERGIDAMLIKRMVAPYEMLDVITAPSDLRYMPQVTAESIRHLITTLKDNYDTIIIDLPHVWLPWVTAAIQQSTQLVLVVQLWLKSVSHAARMMRALRELHVPADRVMAVINRGGAKFKEAIDRKDFERASGLLIQHTLTNDIKAIVESESTATTLMQLKPSQLSQDITALARSLLGMLPVASATKRAGLFSKL